MLQALKYKLVTLFQLILVILFILFEEIVWEGIAKPVYRWVHALKVLQKVEIWLQRVPAEVILALFVLMLVSVEMMGLYAGIQFVSGNIALGLTVYMMKIPIAAFTFWMFRATESKLMRFGWFRWIYGKIMQVIEKLKSLEAYRRTIRRLYMAKVEIKAWFQSLKAAYFYRESPFVKRMKRLYRGMKHILKRD